MLLETTTTAKKMVEVSLPYYSKCTDPTLPDMWYYINKRGDAVTVMLFQEYNKKAEITTTMFLENENSMNAQQRREALQYKPVRPAEFWTQLDKALAWLQEAAFVDRGNLFK